MKTRLFHLSVRLLVLAAILLTPWAATASTVSSWPSAAPDRTRAETALPSRPLLFVPNTGQFDPRVHFQLRGAGGTWWFTDDAIWLTLLEKPSSLRSPSPRSGRGIGREVQPRQGVHLKLTFPGMSPTARLVATDPQPGKVNYFKSSDAAQWRSNLPTYSTLRWEGLYPGVTLSFGQAGAGLGLTVEADTEAALAALQLRVEGADAVRVDAPGRLVADSPIGPIPLPTLLTADGLALEAREAGDTFAFRARSRPVVPLAIQAPADDPSDLLYSTYLGGGDADYAEGIALGPDGSIYVTGVTYSTDFPITPGAFDPSFNGGYDDVFVSRLSADGSTLVYSTYLGGSDQDVVYNAIAVGASGAAYVTGWTLSRNFPTTPGAFQTSCSGFCEGSDAYVTKLSPDGSALVYSTYLGGSGIDLGYGIALGSDGTAYVTGNTDSSDFPVTSNAFDPTCNSCPALGDGYVSRLSADGSSLVYSTYLGGSSEDCLNRCVVAVGRDGSIYVTGNTCSSDFPTTPGAFDTSFNGASGSCFFSTEGDAFVTKLSADGSTLVYSTYLGGSLDDYSYGIAVGADGTAYISGATDSSNFPTTPGAFDTTCNNCPYNDVFVTRLSADGSMLVYSTYLGGSDTTSNYGIAVGADGAAYVTGLTGADDFPTTPGAFQTHCAGCPYSVAYMTKLSPDGSALIYSTYLGGTGGDGAYSLALGPDGAAYITGVTYSTDFPTTLSAYDPSYNGNGDAFISRLSPDLVSMHVAGIAPFYRPRGASYRVGTHVTIQDATGTGVPTTSVTVVITLPSGRQRRATQTTNSQGISTLSFTSALTGTYTFTVTQVVKYGYLYDPSQNVETSDSITIP